MKHKKILAALTAAAIGISLAGCSKKADGPKQDDPGTPPQIESSSESNAPVKSDDTQAVGRVTAVDGKKITVELGELTQRTPGKNGNGSGKNRSGDPDGSRQDRFGGLPGYYFNPSGKTATYDLSGLKEIKIENDSDDTADTVEEIKTGDVVVIELGKDGAVTALTVKSLRGRTGSRDGSGKGSRNGNGNGTDRTGNNNRKNRSSKNNRSDVQNADV